eukprot:365322-Chlamydomonas_euryale.AAC.6
MAKASPSLWWMSHGAVHAALQRPSLDGGDEARKLLDGQFEWILHGATCRSGHMIGRRGHAWAEHARVLEGKGWEAACAGCVRARVGPAGRGTIRPRSTHERERAQVLEKRGRETACAAGVGPRVGLAARGAIRRRRHAWTEHAALAEWDREEHQV